MMSLNSKFLVKYYKSFTACLKGTEAILLSLFSSTAFKYIVHESTILMVCRLYPKLLLILQHLTV